MAAYSALAAFRAKLGLDRSPPGVALPPDLVINGDVDATLLRFLKARQGNLDKAHAMLLKCIEWRTAEDVASIFARPLAETKFQHLTRYFPHAHHGFDKKGQPIYIDCTGQMDVEAVLEGVSKEDVLHSHIIMMEYQNRVLMFQGSQRMGKTVHRMCNIVDMTGASSRLAARKTMEIFKLIAAVDQDNYPETMGATYVVNAPWVFTAVWRVVRAFLDDGVTAKVHILGEGAPTRDALLAAVDADQLPTFLGGTCRCAGGCVSGVKCTAPGGLVASQRQILEFCEEYTHARNARAPLPVPDGAGGLPPAAKAAPARAAGVPAAPVPRRLERNYAFRKPSDAPPMEEPPAPPPPPPPARGDTAPAHAGQPATPVTPSDSERSFDDAAAEALAEAASAKALAAAAAAEAEAARVAALSAHAAVVTAEVDAHAADREARAAAKMAHYAAEEARHAARLASAAAAAVVGTVSATTHAAAAAVARKASYVASTLRSPGRAAPAAPALAEEVSAVFSDAYESLSDEEGS